MCNCIIFVQFSSRARVRLTKVMDVKHEINFKRPDLKEMVDALKSEFVWLCHLAFFGLLCKLEWTGSNGGGGGS